MVTVSLDCTSAKLTWQHHLAVWLWIGWLSVYAVILIVMPPILWFAAQGHEQCRTISTWFVSIMVILLAIPCDRKYQPKWCMELGEWIARRATEYFHMKCVFEDEDALKKAKIFAIYTQILRRQIRKYSAYHVTP